MKNGEWLAEVLGLPSNWHVARTELDRSRRRLDAWICGQRRRSGWFWQSSSGQKEDPSRYRTWRHLGVGDWQCHVHVLLDDLAVARSLDCCGESDSKLSRALSRQALELLGQGLRLPLVATLLALPVEDLWKLRYALESSRPGDMSVTGPAEGDLPAANHPIWTRLVAGEIPFETRVLALQLMLARIRGQVALNADPDAVMLRVAELHRYFSRHQHLLAGELAQLRKGYGS